MKSVALAGAAALSVGVAAPAASASESAPTVVLTSYGAFTRDHNSSGEVAEKAKEILEQEGVQVIYQEIPTEWGSFASNLENLLEENDPDAIISLGERSGNLNAPAVELMGFNQRQGNDAVGAPGNGPVSEGGPAQRQAPEENRAAQKAASAAGNKINISYNAGRYLCNAALYTNLGFLEEGRVAHAGFVHVPARAKGAPQIEKDGEAVASFVKNLVG
ncbi:Pyrrolidone-carboxylate peptidase [Corynebacterium lowii]|uniref:Pyrrolidone-carboxylate peptidase n=2 Tax=Corynebacterium lowii TaxID=1544413 RepID=A0A0Q1E3L1_9CORY|nr:Pyrrolidone-carboxylate peptidase [Corynebacterium lowii]